jgi:glycosyltransferase involved in cell wall biosynthesis
MRVTYVLPFPELNGGNKVVALHAALLARRGHQVTVLGEGDRPAWFPLQVRYLDSRSSSGPPSQDLVVATYWTTIAAAERLRCGPTAHFCQGFEGDLPHMAVQLAAIEQAYSMPLPLLTVTEALGERLQGRFARPFRVTPPTLDRRFSPRLRLGPGRRPWVVVPGIFESAVKDVPTALRALHRLRQEGIAVRVLRLSILPLSNAERDLFVPDSYLYGISPEEVARHFRRADLLILPSLPGEGFGLPLLEAMAAGVPAVASRLPSTEWMAAGAAELVPPGDFVAFADAAGRLLRDGSHWRAARRRGLVAAERFSDECVAPLLESALVWASDGAGRFPPC